MQCDNDESKCFGCRTVTLGIMNEKIAQTPMFKKNLRPWLKMVYFCNKINHLNFLYCWCPIRNKFKPFYHNYH